MQQNPVDIRSIVDLHILNRALEKIAEMMDLPPALVIRVRELNAQNCSLFEANL